MDNLKQEAREELVEVVVDTLNGYDGNTSELHNECFNTDYFIIGTYEAKKWLELNYGVFEAMGKIKAYEMDNFGQVTTDLSQPELVCNMLVYILGEELLACEALQNNWDTGITDEIKDEIIAELKA